jgi:hypothetical protein
MFAYIDGMHGKVEIPIATPTEGCSAPLYHKEKI